MRKTKPFRFLNSWVESDDFYGLVEKIWNSQFLGCKMYILVAKLKLLKVKLKNWHKASHSFLESRLSIARENLTKVQADMRVMQDSNQLAVEESNLLQRILLLKRANYMNLQQRSKINFITCNDENESFFYARIAQRKKMVLFSRFGMVQVLCVKDI